MTSTTSSRKGIPMEASLSIPQGLQVAQSFTRLIQTEATKVADRLAELFNADIQPYSDYAAWLEDSRVGEEVQELVNQLSAILSAFGVQMDKAHPGGILTELEKIKAAWS